jgi:hypothetical protein
MVGVGSGVNLLISYGFGFEIPHAENVPVEMRILQRHNKLDWAATKRSSAADLKSLHR